MTRTKRRAALAAALAAGAMVTLTPVAAQATPGSGVTARTISQTTKNGTDYVVREITVAPGGSTGWHHHDGTLYAKVVRGTLTHNASDCSVDGTYRAPAKFTEPSGADHVHIGRNLGTTPVVMDVLYVLPAGSPLSEDDPNPGCSFQ